MAKFLLVSDIHLGSPHYHADAFNRLLASGNFDGIILCGDLLDSYNLHRLCKKQWKTMSLLRKLSKKMPCVFLRGNHDRECETISTLLGFDFLETYSLRCGNKNILFCHGDVFDHFVSQNPFLTEIASTVYHWIKIADKKSKKIAPKIKKLIKTWHNASDKLHKKACEHALKTGHDLVVCGHTHIQKKTEHGGVECYNLGSQCENSINYGFLDTETGQITLHHEDA